MFTNCVRDIDTVTCSNSERGMFVEGTNFVSASSASDAPVSLRLQRATRYLTIGYETMMLISVGVYVIADLCFGEFHF